MNMLAEWKLLEGVPMETLTGWAVILSGLSLLGVIYVVWNMYKLARNQVKLALMLEELLRRQR